MNLFPSLSRSVNQTSLSSRTSIGAGATGSATQSQSAQSPVLSPSIDQRAPNTMDRALAVPTANSTQNFPPSRTVRLLRASGEKSELKGVGITFMKVCAHHEAIACMITDLQVGKLNAARVLAILVNCSNSPLNDGLIYCKTSSAVKSNARSPAQLRNSDASSSLLYPSSTSPSSFRHFTPQESVRGPYTITSVLPGGPAATSGQVPPPRPHSQTGQKT